MKTSEKTLALPPSPHFCLPCGAGLQSRQGRAGQGQGSSREEKKINPLNPLAKKSGPRSGPEPSPGVLAGGFFQKERGREAAPHP